MRRIHLTAFALAAVLSAVGYVIAGTDTDDAMLKQIAGYRQWTRLTKKPFFVLDPSAAAG